LAAKDKKSGPAAASRLPDKGSVSKVSGSAKRTLSRLLGLGVALAVLGGLGVFVISGFVEGRQEAASEAEREGPIKPPLRVKLPARGEPIVTFDAATQKTIGLELMTPSAAPYEDHVRAYGTVLDLANLTTLNTTYVSAVSQLNTAQAKLAASQPAYARAQALYAKDVGSLAQMQTTEAAVLGDKASVSAAESQVRTLAATALQEWGPVIGRALVASAGLVNRLIEREEFLLQITLPPSVSIDPPPTASVEVGGSPRRVDVRYISPATRTDPKIQGLSFFYAAAANSGVLPGMNVRAYLASGHSVEGYIVPTAAVVWWSGRAWVYLRLDEGSFSRREIPTDTPTRDGDGFVVPVHAFGEADDPPQIVTKAAQLLLSEEFRAQIQVGGDND
jgi:hypothetical protein